MPEVINRSNGIEAIQSPGIELNAEPPPPGATVQVRWFTAVRSSGGLGSFLRFAGVWIGGAWEWGHAGGIDMNPGDQVTYAALASTSLLDYTTRLFGSWQHRFDDVETGFPGSSAIVYQSNSNLDGGGYTATMNIDPAIGDKPWGEAMPSHWTIGSGFYQVTDAIADIDLSSYSDTVMNTIAPQYDLQWSTSLLTTPIAVASIYSGVIGDLLGATINTDFTMPCWLITYNDFGTFNVPTGFNTGIGIWDYSSNGTTGNPSDYDGILTQSNMPNGQTIPIGAANLLSGLVSQPIVDTGWRVHPATGIICGLGQIKWNGSVNQTYWIGKLIGYDFGSGPGTGEAYFNVAVVSTGNTLHPGDVYTVPWDGGGAGDLPNAPLPLDNLPGNAGMPITCECYFLAFGSPPGGVAGDHYWP